MAALPAFRKWAFCPDDVFAVSWRASCFFAPQDAASRVPMYPPEAVDMSITLLIPESSAGRLIGRSGERLRSLRLTSGAQICCASKQPAAMSVIPERQLSITGKLPQVIIAVAGVVDALHSDPSAVVYTHTSVSFAATSECSLPAASSCSVSTQSPVSSVSLPSELRRSNRLASLGDNVRPTAPPPLSVVSVMSCPGSPVPDEVLDGEASVASATASCGALNHAAQRSRTPSHASSSSVEPVRAGNPPSRRSTRRPSAVPAPSPPCSPSYLMPASPHGFAYMYPPAYMPSFAPGWVYQPPMMHWAPAPSPPEPPTVSTQPARACPRCASRCSCITDTFPVPDAVVGAVLGKGGATLRWLQHHTNTRIVLSPRDADAERTALRYVDDVVGVSIVCVVRSACLAVVCCYSRRSVSVTGQAANVSVAKHAVLERVTAQVASFRGILSMPPAAAAPVDAARTEEAVSTPVSVK